MMSRWPVQIKVWWCRDVLVWTHVDKMKNNNTVLSGSPISLPRLLPLILWKLEGALQAYGFVDMNNHHLCRPVVQGQDSMTGVGVKPLSNKFCSNAAIGSASSMSNLVWNLSFREELRQWSSVSVSMKQGFFISPCDDWLRTSNSLTK